MRGTEIKVPVFTPSKDGIPGTIAKFNWEITALDL